MLEHLRDRGLYCTRVFVSSDTATFYLWNFSGQLTGYHRYNPSLCKKHKYFTYGGGVWGLEKFNPELPTLFVVEGVFDACTLHNLGLNAIAVLGNNPKKLKSWLRTMPVITVAVCDGDSAGSKLANCCDYAVHCPSKLDLNDIFYGAASKNAQLVRSTLNSLKRYAA